MSDEEIREYGKQARARIEAGKYTDAEYFFKKITKLEPDNWQAWYGRGLCFKRMEMFERAIYVFTKVTTLQPENPKGWYNLGFCQSQTNQIEDALFNLNKAIKLDPSFAIAVLIKAWIFKKHGNKEMANKLISHIKENNVEFVQKITSKHEENQPLDFKIAIELINTS